MRLWVIIGVVVAAGIAAAAIVYATWPSDSESSSLDPQVATAYVNAQANALCLVQTKSFPTQAKLAAAYEDARKSSNLSAEEMAEAQDAAEQDEALRTRISERVDAICG
jgi:hypothetical protein